LRGIRAFTLMEVLIASAIFFMAVFVILGLVGSSLRMARSLQHKTVDAGALAAELALTNVLTEGTASGDFGNLYPDYRWTSDTEPSGTNGLYEVDYVIYRRNGDHGIESAMSILLFKPDSISFNKMGLKPFP
jgi:hypothetical protein